MVEARLRGGICTLAALTISACSAALAAGIGAGAGPAFMIAVCLCALAAGAILTAGAIAMLGRAHASRTAIHALLETAGMLVVTTPVVLLVGAWLRSKG